VVGVTQPAGVLHGAADAERQVELGSTTTPVVPIWRSWPTQPRSVMTRVAPTLAPMGAPMAASWAKRSAPSRPAPPPRMRAPRPGRWWPHRAAGRRRRWRRVARRAIRGPPRAWSTVGGVVTCARRRARRGCSVATKRRLGRQPLHVAAAVACHHERAARCAPRWPAAERRSRAARRGARSLPSGLAGQQHRRLIGQDAGRAPRPMLRAGRPRARRG
jgi:hypothetical protein